MSPAAISLPASLSAEIPNLSQLEVNAPRSWYLLPIAVASLCLLCLFLLWKTRPGWQRHPAASVAADRVAAALRRRRSRRRRFVIFLGLVLTSCVAWLTLLVWSAGQGKAFNPHKPFWWLMASSGRIKDPSGDDSDAVIEELQNRLRVNALSDGQILAIARRTLEFQQDPQRTDTWMWGNLVEQARAMKDVPDDLWQQYLRQGLAAPPVELVVRDQVRRGDPLPAQLRPTGHPRFSGSKLYVTYDLDQTLTVAGQAFGQPAPRTAGPPALGLDERPAWAVDLSPALISQLKNGPQSAQTKVAVKVYDPPFFNTVAYTATYTLTAHWNLVPATASTVTPIPPPAVPPAAAPDFSKQLAFQIIPLSNPPGRYGVSLAYSYTAPPYADLAFQIFLRTRQGEWEVGSGATSRNNPYLFWDKQLPGFDPGDVPAWVGRPQQVDVVLRPSMDAALRSVDCYQYWDGEIVIPNVRGRW